MNETTGQTYGIIADSCCDVTPQIRQRLDMTSVPLHLYLGDRHYIDDDTLDIAAFMKDMKLCKDKVGTASPSPDAYRSVFLRAGHSFVVTLSSKLSGSFMSADAGKRLAEEKGASVHIFDSKSASAGELLIVMKLRELIDEGLKKCDIISKVDKMIKDMKTIFMLENLDNLVKNGRMGRLQERLCTAMQIRPIFCAKDGEISLIGKARGEAQIIERFIREIVESKRDTSQGSLVITHCGNQGLAQRVREAVESRFSFKEILVVATNGVSSIYANEKGVILAF